MKKKVLSAIAIAAVGVATGGTILTSIGGADPAPQLPPPPAISAVTALAGKDKAVAASALARLDKSPLLANRGDVSDIGVVATTVDGPGARKLDVRVDAPKNEVCTGDRPDGGAINGSWCASLPIPISAVPYAASTSKSDGRLSLNALVPDNVNSVTATNTDGVSRTVAPASNVAFVLMPDNTPIKRVDWTTASGEHYGQDVPEGATQ